MALQLQEVLRPQRDIQWHWHGKRRTRCTALALHILYTGQRTEHKALMVSERVQRGLRACESFMSCSVQGGCLGTSHRHDSAKSLTIKRRISQRIRDVQGQATLVWVERLAAYLAHAKIVFGSQHDTGQAVVCRQRD